MTKHLMKYTADVLENRKGVDNVSAPNKIEDNQKFSWIRTK